MLVSIILIGIFVFMCFMFASFAFAHPPEEEERPLYPQVKDFCRPPLLNKIIYDSSIKDEDLKLAIYENMARGWEYTIPYLKEMFEYTNNDESISTQKLCAIMSRLCYDERFKIKRQMAYDGRSRRVYYVKE